MAQYDKSKANPDLIGNFVLVRNKQKTEAKHQIWYIQTAPMRMVMLR